MTGRRFSRLSKSLIDRDDLRRATERGWSPSRRKEPFAKKFHAVNYSLPIFQAVSAQLTTPRHIFRRAILFYSECNRPPPGNRRAAPRNLLQRFSMDRLEYSFRGPGIGYDCWHTFVGSGESSVEDSTGSL